MSTKKRLICLMLIMLIVVVGVAGATISILYDAVFTETRARMVEMVESQARLIESVAEFDANYSTEDIEGGAFAATLSQIEQAHSRLQGFGETGEFTLAKHEGDLIVFLLRHRNQELEKPKSIPFDSEFDEPMKQALSGQSGTSIVLDYRGEKVLVAYEPVSELNLGIVAKIDLAEIRAPFIRAGLIAGIIGFALIIVGSISFLRIGNPMVREMRESEKRYRTLFEDASEGILIADIETKKFRYANPAICKMLGYSSQEILQIGVIDIHPKECREYVISEFEVQARGEKSLTQNIPCLHKDGSIIYADFCTSLIIIDGIECNVGFVTDITERKQAETAIFESERKLSFHLQNTPIAAIEWDLDFRVTEWNTAAERIFGFSKEEALGKHAAGLIISASAREHVDNVWSDLLKNKGGCRSTNENITNKGNTIICDWHNTPLIDKDGNVYGVATLVQDITDRRRAEEGLLERETMFKKAFHSGNALMAISTIKDGQFVDVNNEFLRISEYERDEVIGRTSNELNLFWDQDQRGKIVKAMEKTGCARDIEILLRTKSDKKRYGIFSAEKIRVGTDELLFTVMNDITEHERNKETLRKSEEKFKTFFESSSAGIATSTMDGLFLEVNDSFLKITGYTFDELRELTYQELTPEKWHALEKEMFSDTIKTGNPQNFEKEYRRKDGSIVPILVNSWIIRDRKGVPNKLGAIVTNITERKRVEEALRNERNILQEVMNGAKDIHLVYLDRDFNFVRVNKTYADTCGYAPSEMIGKNHFDLYPHAENEAIFKKVLDTGESFYVKDKPFTFPDQPERGVTYWDWSLNPVKGEQRDVDGLVFSLVETTERKRAEERLKDSERRNHAWLENSPVCTKVVDSDFNLQFMSLAGIKALKIDDVTEFYGKPYPFSFYPESFRNQMTANLEKARETGEIVAQETSVVDIEGNELWYHSTLVPVSDDEGRTEYIMIASIETTERKRAEDILQESESELRAIYENAPIIMLLVDGERRVVKMNAEALLKAGLSMDEVIGFRGGEALRCVHALDNPNGCGFGPVCETCVIRSSVLRTFQSGETLRHKEALIPHNHEDGPVDIYFLVSTSRLNVSGKDFVLVCLEDITKRKQADEELRKSERLLNEAQRIAIMGSWTWDLESNDVSWSNNMCLIHGLEPGTFDRQFDTVMSLIHPDDLGSVQEKIQKMLDNKKPVDFEYRIITKDGVVKFVRGSQKLTFDDEGELVQIVGILQDITESNQIENDLRRSETFQRTLSEALPDFIFVLDKNGVIRKANRLHPGHRKEEVIAKKASAFISPKYRGAFEEAFRQALDTGQFQTVETEVDLPDGHYYFLNRISPMYLDEEEQLFVLISTDISERKLAEESIKSSLYEKEILLQEVHHRVKNNLQVISSLFNMQSDYAINTNISSIFQEAQNRIKSMALVHEELYQSQNLEKIELGKYLKILVGDLIKSYSHISPQININFNTEIIFLNVDTMIPLGLITNELISNSLKHAFKGREQGEIHITLSQNNKYILTISDNGIGVPDGRDLSSEGTLGFEIVKVLVNQLGGSIELSKSGGSTFKIEFGEEQSSTGIRDNECTENISC